MNQFNGPWKVQKMDLHETGKQLDGIEVVDARGYAVACNQTYYPTALNPAYAPLIAAAPEMLEALERLVEAIEYTPLGVRAITALQEARQIINKAKGE